jgi:hypothetical protein
MAKFTRKAIRDIIGENCTDEIENSIMALHLGVTDPMKDELTDLRAKADQLEDVTKERDALKAGDNFKAKYEKEHQDFEDYKKSIAEKDELATKESAVKAYFEEKGIVGSNLAIALRGAKEEINALKLNDGKIADTASLDALVGGEYAGLVSTQETRGAKMATPPGGDKKPDYSSMSDEDYYKATYEKTKKKE